MIFYLVAAGCGVVILLVGAVSIAEALVTPRRPKEAACAKQ